MQLSIKNGGGIICDSTTELACRNRLKFEKLGVVKVKGRHNEVEIVQPYVKKVSEIFRQHSQGVKLVNSYFIFPALIADD